MTERDKVTSTQSFSLSIYKTGTTKYNKILSPTSSQGSIIIIITIIIIIIIIIINRSREDFKI